VFLVKNGKFNIDFYGHVKNTLFNQLIKLNIDFLPKSFSIIIFLFVFDLF